MGEYKYRVELLTNDTLNYETLGSNDANLVNNIIEQALAQLANNIGDSGILIVECAGSPVDVQNDCTNIEVLNLHFGHCPSEIKDREDRNKTH